MSDVTTNLDSEFIEQTEDGGVWVTLGAPQAFQLPTGHIVEPDGTLSSCKLISSLFRGASKPVDKQF